MQIVVPTGVNGPYRAILADPPWQYHSPRALVGGKPGSVQVDVSGQYPTMALADICRMVIPAADSCALFMWVTNPMLADGSGTKVVEIWGFKPVTVLTWAKVQTDGKTPSMRSGHFFRSASEHVIFATKGRVPRVDGYPAIPTWFPHTRLPHSVKPDNVHRLAEQVVPGGPYLEMFARRAAPGWDVWGDQAPAPVDPDGWDLI